jgi:murein DD-endopeptidase MepM/ murein hydrolase activator NlpD
VLAYNHAQWYVDEVLQLSKTFGDGGADVTFHLDRLQVSLEQARRDVVRANKRLVASQRTERVLAAAERRALRRVDSVALLSRQLELQKTATLVGVRHHEASLRVERLRKKLTAAQDALEQAKTEVAMAPAAAAPMFDAPNAQSGYVFPVGGGPSVVSVGHTHHDYPAADIAAPEGTPVYALADAAVVRAWSYPDARCGIGLTLETAGGVEWTYCHLSYLEPTVQTGAVLSAGDPVGLVGHTGHATGPHLHLQLNPPTEYPQAQPWFEQFAGIAFRWQDAATPEPDVSASRGPVFVQVPNAPDSAAASDGVVRFTR